MYVFAAHFIYLTSEVFRLEYIAHLLASQEHIIHSPPFTVGGPNKSRSFGTDPSKNDRMAS